MKIFLLMILLSFMIENEKKSQEVVFGGGCFWCTEAFFREIKGVIDVSPGYSGGTTKNPSYEEVCKGITAHAEVVRIRYNPDQIEFEKLLEVFFLTHDPTSVNHQGADVGTQYRSVVFYTTLDQKKMTLEMIRRINESNSYPNPIVTEVSPLITFYPAENNHRNYFNQHKNQSYCRIIIQPKMAKFRKAFDDILKDK
jgi:peptide-methionine (S)-S-oxide reductase